MSIVSTLRQCCNYSRNLLRNVKNTDAGKSIRFMSDHKQFHIVPSRFQYAKFKDTLHFYFMLGLIPSGLLVLYCNLFIGPATLTPIPEGYTPKHYEYYKHPITRFIARYMLTTPQQEYEKYMHFLYEEDEYAKINLLERKIKGLMNARSDYQAYYFVPYTKARQTRAERERAEYHQEHMGTNL